MKEENLSFVFDPSDWKAMIELMDKRGDSGNMYSGSNEDKESIFLSISHDKIVCVTLQKNGWVRRNTYWRDGNREETFDGRWDK